MKLFEPGRIGNLEIKNRMVVSAMVSNYCTEDGMPTEKFIAYHEHKAKGGWGLIITEDYAISPTAGGFKKLPGLWEDAQIEPHKAFTNRIHAAGGKICVQIYHAGRETSSKITGVQCVAPSALKDPTMDEMPKELTIDEIHTIINEFGDCAYRAKKAGFDAVEIHGAHGYLIGQFVSPFSNKRQDEYGGCAKNRSRFACEIVENIKEKSGNDFPVLYRMSSVEYVDGGMDIEDAKVLAKFLEDAGVDCIHCSQGIYTSMPVVIPPYAIPKGYYSNNAAELKKVVNIPVIAVGRINDEYVAESILESGKADFVTMARTSLADPDFPNKIKEGKNCEVSRCIGCVQGCIGENGKGNPIRCLVNPITGMEDVYDLKLTDNKKNIVILGGGVSGCEAAISAAMKGHSVTLIEQTNQLGGQWYQASVPIGKTEYITFVQWQKTMLKKYNVDVRLNVSATKKSIEDLHPDVIVDATGSRPFIPPVKGTDMPMVMTSADVLQGKRDVGKSVAVIGGGLVGAEVAEMLAMQCDKVLIVEMMPSIMKDCESNQKYYINKHFKEYGVEVKTSTKLLELKENSIIVEENGKQLEIKNIDSVIFASGVKARNELDEILNGIDIPVVKVGDANKIKNGYLNIREGFEVGLNI